MTELGSIYGTTNVDGSNTLVIDFSNVDISGNLKVKGGLAIDNSFGNDGQVLTSKGNGALPEWSNVYYADKTGVLTGHKDITAVVGPGGSSYVWLYGDGGNNVCVNYSDRTDLLEGLNGAKSITAVIHSFGSSNVWLFGNGGNNVCVYYANFAGQLSDDRIKWNETPINTDRTIEIVKRLKFYQYDILKEAPKSSLDPEEPYNPSKCKVGFGVIAQEIEELSNEYPELKDTPVQLGEIKGVDYNNIFALLGATTQMLISRIETLENEVKQLKAK